MNSFVSLTYYTGKNFFREKGIIIMLALFPIILLVSAKASAPDLQFTILISGAPHLIEASSLLVLLYGVTAVVFVASITSFFVTFNIKDVVPRLRNVGYSNLQITVGYLLIIILINVFTTIIVLLLSKIWLDINYNLGYIIGLFLSSFIFSTIGMIISEIVTTKTMGIYTLLTLGMLDTAFLENPVFSRRYNESWIDFMAR